MMRSGWVASGLLAAAVLVSAPKARAAATFVLDAQGAAFEDSTPATPVGGNPGTTLGEQRKNAVQHALDIWGEVLTSSVPIEVRVTFDVLDNCAGGSVILGQAMANGVAQANNPAAGNDTTLHPIALANALEGMDLEPGSPDIIAEFNSALDQGCIQGVKWYYGFDGEAGGDEDFVTTALHEVGHGLGFASFVDEAGGLLAGIPDIYSLFSFDLTQQKHWDEMQASERRASSVNPRGLVWSGANVKRETNWFLHLGTPKLKVSPPLAGLSGRISEQVIGPRLPATGLTGTLVVADPIHGCDVPVNLSEIAGNVVLVDSVQGGAGCTPIQAQIYMELAGAAAVLSVEPPWDGMVGSDPPTPVYGSYGPDFPEPQKVPIFAVTYADGLLLEDAAGSTITLEVVANQPVGADPTGRPYLFATDPYQGGSSVSHWDTFARHNLLMEPTSSPDIKGTDITRFMMQDMGWPICGDGVKQGDEECDDGNAVAMDGCTPGCKPEVCGDGEVNQTSEECDDGNTVAMDGCGPTCKKEVCGDGEVNQTSEKCDDGNTADGDGCSAECLVESCGDGKKNLASEECDDGNMVSGDGCENDCTVTPGFEPGSGGSSSSGSGAGGNGTGAGSSGEDAEESSGCLCQAAGRRASPAGALGWFGAALAFAALRRRGVSRARVVRA